MFNQKSSHNKAIIDFGIVSVDFWMFDIILNLYCNTFFFHILIISFSAKHLRLFFSSLFIHIIWKFVSIHSFFYFFKKINFLSAFFQMFWILNLLFCINLVYCVVMKSHFIENTFFLQNDYDHCSPDPCQNGASCFNTQQDYYCHCPEGWQGKNCSQPRLLCDNPPCRDIGTLRIFSQFFCIVLFLKYFDTKRNIFDFIVLLPNVFCYHFTALGNCDGICGDHGRCVSLTGIGHSCQCEPGYTGKYCHESKFLINIQFQCIPTVFLQI